MNQNNDLNDRQKSLYSLYLKCGKNIAETAKTAGMTINATRKTIGRINKKLNSTPVKTDDSNIVKSTSTLYDRDGNVINKWVKADTSRNELKRLSNVFMKEYISKIPKYTPEDNYTFTKYENKLVVYPISDAHIGMLSWVKETGTNYDVKTADKTIRTFVKKIIDNSCPCKECLILNLGDFLHVDNQVYQTERSGNILDVDGRYAKIVNVAVKVMRYMIEYALAKHKKVTVVNCMGNHDDLGAIWIKTALKHIYENEKRLVIDDSPAKRYYHKFGQTLIGCTHGSDVKSKDLPIIMATEKKEDWGNTKFHYFYTGHWHQDSVVEVGDCKVESFRALCAKDAWSISKGYLTGRDIKAIFIDPNYGEVERYTINI